MMSITVYLRNVSRIGLGTIALSLLMQPSYAIAQTTFEDDTLDRINVAQPDLLPIQPTLPNTSEQNTSHEEVRLILKRKQRRLYVYRGDTLVANYLVAVGKPGWETPIGNFKVLEMLEDPGWISPFTGEIVHPGPNNPMGERLITFWTDGKDYIGFHGTPNRTSVGKAISSGCVRMYNENIRELYKIVKVGTLVIVEPD